MIAVHQQVAIAAATFVTLSMFGTQAPAQASDESFSGKISFAESLLPHGFNSKACKDFRVLVEQPEPFFPQPSPRPSVPNLIGPKMEFLGETNNGANKISGSVKSGMVECAYSIHLNLGTTLYGQVTVKPEGKPRGYAGLGVFNPSEKIVNGKRCSGSCHFSKLDFVFYSQVAPK